MLGISARRHRLARISNHYRWEQMLADGTRQLDALFQQSHPGPFAFESSHRTGLSSPSLSPELRRRRLAIDRFNSEALSDDVKRHGLSVTPKKQKNGINGMNGRNGNGDNKGNERTSINGERYSAPPGRLLHRHRSTPQVSSAIPIRSNDRHDASSLSSASSSNSVPRKSTQLGLSSSLPNAASILSRRQGPIDAMRDSLLAALSPARTSSSSRSLTSSHASGSGVVGAGARGSSSRHSSKHTTPSSSRRSSLLNNSINPISSDASASTSTPPSPATSLNNNNNNNNGVSTSASLVSAPPSLPLTKSLSRSPTSPAAPPLSSSSLTNGIPPSLVGTTLAGGNNDTDIEAEVMKAVPLRPPSSLSSLSTSPLSVSSPSSTGGGLSSSSSHASSKKKMIKITGSRGSSTEDALSPELRLADESMTAIHASHINDDDIAVARQHHNRSSSSSDNDGDINGVYHVNDIIDDREQPFWQRRRRHSRAASV
jgi:hypothetical protein